MSTDLRDGAPARPRDGGRGSGGASTATAVGAYLSGLLMGSADLVPGVSGGTIALVVGIYERLVANLHTGAGAAGRLLQLDLRDTVRLLRRVEWAFLVPLLAGVLSAVAALAGVLRTLLETQPAAMSGLFFGLVVGSVLVGLESLDDRRPPQVAIGLAVAVVVFLGLGLRAGRVDDPSLLVLFGGGALAVCAMILPGISGSFILLILGLYTPVITAVDERQLAAVAAVAAGATVGLALFATGLDWMLRRYHAPVLAALIGLMAGSLRVLWPWPAGADGVGDTGLGAPVAAEVPLVSGLAVLGLIVVVLIGVVARRLVDRTG